MVKQSRSRLKKEKMLTVEEYIPRTLEQVVVDPVCVGVCERDDKIGTFAPVMAAVTIDIVTNQINIIKFWKEFRDKGDEIRMSVLANMFRINAEVINVIADVFSLDENLVQRAHISFMNNMGELSKQAFIDGYLLAVNSMLPKEQRRPEFPFEPIMFPMEDDLKEKKEKEDKDGDPKKKD